MTEYTIEDIEELEEHIRVCKENRETFRSFEKFGNRNSENSKIVEKYNEMIERDEERLMLVKQLKNF